MYFMMSATSATRKIKRSKAEKRHVWGEGKHYRGSVQNHPL